ncbi:OsmC family protein [Micromonospora sp. NPDC049559]|uniref:OsmC family protein n=1 Tax=Micromonospora sp. NPDC049559 TaxID=3155923 RepID=UPI003423A9C5
MSNQANERKVETGGMTTVDNGVNVQALLDARQALKGAPEAAQFTWRATAKWQNGVHSTTRVRNFFGLGQEQTHRSEAVFDADHPEVFAAEDNGITPIEYLLVGLASCLTAGVASVAQNRGIQLRSVEATVEGQHDIRGILGVDSDVRNGYNDIKVTFNIDADASEQEIEALVAQSQKRSAVFDALTNPTNVTVEVA